MTADARKYGPWALVTGANSGIGAAFADTLQAAAKGLARRHVVQTSPVVVDLSASGFLARITNQTADIDIGLLVSNAADAAMGAMLRVALSRLTQMLKLNTQTHPELVHHVGRQFEGRGAGGILLVSSTAGLRRGVTRLVAAIGASLGKSHGRNLWGGLMKPIVPAKLRVH